jgi:hypothetical protein
MAEQEHENNKFMDDVVTTFFVYYIINISVTCMYMYDKHKNVKISNYLTECQTQASSIWQGVKELTY